MKKKSMIFIGIICSLAIVIVLYKNNTKKNEEIFLQYGDSVFDINCSNLESNKSLKNTDKKYKIILYIDPHCESCIKSYGLGERMYEIFKDEKIGVNILWRKTPSKSILKRIDIPIGEQYVLNNTNLSNPFPTYFILDENNKIILLTDNTEKIIKKVFTFEGVSKDQIIHNANQYLLKKLEGDKNGPALIYFSMEGCGDCKEATEMIKNNHLRKKYNILEVYTEESYGEQEIVDVGNFFLNIYGIEWYPSFLILENEDYTFIGETKIEDLEKLFLSKVEE